MKFFNYLGTIFRPFFCWWWALITGIATLLAFFNWKAKGMTLSGTLVALLFMLFFTLLFLVISVITQGFKWYTKAHCNPEVIACASATPDSKLEVFHIKSLLPLEPGQVISLLRTFDDRVTRVGMLKVERRLNEYYQCVPLWFGSGHRQDLKLGKLQPRHLTASLFLNESDLSRYLKDGGEQ